MPPASSAAHSVDQLLVSGAGILGIHLEASAVAAFGTYREEIVRWSERMNLTALKTPEEIVRQGFLDSLACAPLLPVAPARILDVGSGAGFPAIPLALVRPELGFTLVEPSRKKVTFLRHVLRRLELTSVRIVPNRLESLIGAKTVELYDIALARAVGPLSAVARMVLPFLRFGGIFLAQIGTATRLDTGTTPLVLDFELMEARDIPAVFGKAGRKILVLRKSGRA